MSQLSTDINQQDIISAFSESYFELYYQPQVSLENPTQVLGAEAFIRLNHPVLGLLYPQSFLPLIKSMDKMLALTEFVLIRVIEDWKRWNASNIDLNISVNIEHGLFENPEFKKLIERLLDDQAFPSRRITLEISESKEKLFNRDLEQLLLWLRKNEFRLSLDDFGVSELSEKYFNQLPIDEIKIHRQIISGLSELTAAKNIVKKALHLANQSGVRVIAVGVENQIEADWLKEHNCNCAQGYLFGKPMGTEQFYSDILEGQNNWTFVENKGRKKLLIVESESTFREMLAESLSDIYEVFIATSAREAEVLYDAFLPEILVVALDLPDLPGDKLHQKLTDKQFSAFNTIFISSTDDLKTRLSAYEVGGVDVLNKPFSVTELMAKIGRVASYQDKSSQLSTDVDQYQDVATQSLKEAAHYGDVIQLFKQLFHCESESEIAQSLFAFMEKKSLLCSVQFRNKDNISTFLSNGEASTPIEINVFELLINNGRLFDFGKRTIVNDNHVSILIKNMPNSSEEHGRVRDYMAVVIEGLEARYIDLLRQQMMTAVFDELKALAIELSSIMSSESKQQADILEAFTTELSLSFHVLEMTEEQEAHITAIVEKMLNMKDETQINAEDIESRISQIVVQLESFMKDSIMLADKKSASDTAIRETVELF